MVFNFQVVSVFCISAFLISLILNQVFLRFSTNLGTRSTGEVRFASTSKPSVGGFSFYFSFLLCFITIALLYPDFILTGQRQAAGFFAACSLGFMLGFADDAYNTNPVLKFFGQIACGLILVFTDLYIPLLPVTLKGGFLFNAVFTVIWVIGIMNSMNMLDNMDAVTSTVSICILSCGLYILSRDGFSDIFLTLIIAGMMAALIGFLVFNWPPARMYMGDTGSQFLGIFLASIAVKLFWDFKDPGNSGFQVRQLLIPLLAFIMPIMDTTTVFIRRLARGHSPFKGGTDHTTHHLAYLGLPVPAVILIFAVINLLSVYFIYLIMTRTVWNYTYSYLVIGYFVTLFLIVQFIYDLGAKRKPREE